MTPREKRDMPYIIGLACLAATLMVAACTENLVRVDDVTDSAKVAG